MTLSGAISAIARTPWKSFWKVAYINVMWGSDYPHRDGTWPFSRKAIEEQFRGIDPTIQRKMLWENVRRVYRIAERSEEHTSELQSLAYLVCRLLLEKKKKDTQTNMSVW